MKLQNTLTYQQRSAIERVPRANQPVRLSTLPDDSYFKVGSQNKVYHKIGNSHAVDTVTDKDAIFTLNCRVHRVHPSFKFRQSREADT